MILSIHKNKTSFEMMINHFFSSSTAALYICIKGAVLTDKFKDARTVAVPLMAET